jgi:uncharacterized oligopeptide transporter (OPT) family protein
MQIQCKAIVYTILFIGFLIAAILGIVVLIVMCHYYTFLTILCICCLILLSTSMKNLYQLILNNLKNQDHWWKSLI